MVKKKFVRLVSILVVVLLCLSCNTNHDKAHHPRAFVNLYARYISSSNNLKAEASIRVGDSLNSSTHVEFPSGISFHGNPMSKKELPSRLIRYGHSQDSRIDGPGVFRFVDIEDNPREVYVDISGPNSFAFKENALNLNRDNYLTWDGKPLTDQEQIIIIFTEPAGKSLISTINGPTTSSESKIPMEELMSLSGTPLKAYLVKKRKEEKTLGCNVLEITTEFYTGNISLNLIPKK